MISKYFANIADVAFIISLVSPVVTFVITQYIKANLVSKEELRSSHSLMSTRFESTIHEYEQKVYSYQENTRRDLELIKSDASHKAEKNELYIANIQTQSEARMEKEYSRIKQEFEHELHLTADKLRNEMEKTRINLESKIQKNFDEIKTSIDAIRDLIMKSKS